MMRGTLPLLFLMCLDVGGAAAQGTTAADAVAQSLPPAMAAAPIQPKTCSLVDMLDGLRHALHRGSPALRRYARDLLKESTLSLPPEQVRAAFLRERDPQIVEALGAALAARTARTGDPSIIKPQLERATNDGDPAVRAAAVRSLRGIGSVESMVAAGTPGYERLIRDPAPEVRQAVVENLLGESAKVYFGHDQAVSEKAVQVAAASPDPGLTARLLSEVSTESIGHRAVEELGRMLVAGPPEVRAAAALALGGVPAAESADARTALEVVYGKDADPQVRRAVLASLVRLGMGQSMSLLESLRPIDPTMAGEIDGWLSALASGLQEWSLLLREKQRLDHAPQPQQK
jgi:HEAT repeat protein